MIVISLGAIIVFCCWISFTFSPCVISVFTNFVNYVLVEQKMSRYQAEGAEYMADEYEMEDVDDDMDDELRGRDNGGSDSDVDEYDAMVLKTYIFSFVCIIKMIFSFLLFTDNEFTHCFICYVFFLSDSG